MMYLFNECLLSNLMGKILCWVLKKKIIYIYESKKWSFTYRINLSYIKQIIFPCVIFTMSLEAECV